MRIRTSGVATNVLLSALVLAWGVAPSAIRHGHEGGEDTSHRHDAVAHHGHHDDARGHLTNEDSQAVEAELSSAVLRNLVVHLHWNLLGVDFSVPVSEDEQPSDGSSAEELVVVPLVDSVPNPVLDRGGGVNCDSVTVQQPGLDAAVDEPPSLTTAAPTQSAPLCDCARHERSGVLLV